jgi:ElaB/YqjD/DUF883 family membrane-anchored ribosome-binding protein
MEPYENRVLPAGTPARSSDELLDEFKSLIHQGQELLNATKHLSGEALTTFRDQFQFKWDDARGRLNDFQSYAAERSQHARELTVSYVHDHPWWAVSVATGLGVLIGYSLNRRSHAADREIHSHTRH